MAESIDILELNSRQDWRGWLESNHALSTGVWLAQYKVNAANGRLTYAESVEEALCFGWIDGQTRAWTFIGLPSVTARAGQGVSGH